MTDTTNDPFGLRGKSIAVTGTGSGIGRTIALSFAGQGARVAMLELDDARLTETKSLIENAGGEALAAPASPKHAALPFPAVESGNPRTLPKPCSSSPLTALPTSPAMKSRLTVASLGTFWA